MPFSTINGNSGGVTLAFIHRATVLELGCNFVLALIMYCEIFKHIESITFFYKNWVNILLVDL